MLTAPKPGDFVLDEREALDALNASPELGFCRVMALMGFDMHPINVRTF